MSSSRRLILEKLLAVGGGPNSRNKGGKRRSLHARGPQTLRIQLKCSEAESVPGDDDNAPGGVLSIELPDDDNTPPG